MSHQPVSANLELAFDVGHSSIGWSVLQTPLDAQPSSLNLLGCGVVTFGADDCLASKRRDYRRQRRHARSTRHRIARMEKLLAHSGVLSVEQLAAKHQQAGGHSAPWLLAARVLTSNGAKEQLLDWPTLWDVLRWYAHNRGYDGNRRWADSDSAEAKEDTEKEQHAIALMTEHGKETMAETLCGALGLKPLAGQQASLKNFKRLNAAFPRHFVEAEVRRLLDLHTGHLPQLDAAFIKVLMEDWKAIPCPAIRLPARYSGGLLFGQLVPRFDNRIITRCPISGDKVPAKKSPEFLRYRWAMQLANIQVASFAQEKLHKLNTDERAALHKLMVAKGALTEGELKKAVRGLPGVVRDNLETMLMHPDAKDALVFDPVQKLLSSAELAPLWQTLSENLQARFRGKLRHGKAVTLATLRAALADAVAFDAELQRQLDAQNTRKGKQQKNLSRDDFLAKSYDTRKALASISGRAPYSRTLLQQAYEQVLAGHDPREEGGCLFRSEEIRQREVQKKLEDQTNNHLVRHRLLILERLLKDLVNAPEFAAGQPERITRVTIEVNRDIREFSGKTAKEIQMDLGSRLKNFKSVADKLERAFDGQTYNGKPVAITAGLIRKARIAEDLGWECPYTGQSFEPVHLVSRAVDKDHVIPRSQRPSDSLDSLVVTFSEVNKMKGQRTAWQFIQEFGGKPVEGMAQLMIRTPKQFQDFVTNLESFKGHDDDKRRKKKRKDLLLLEKFEDKGFVPRDLTVTSQLVRLGAQVIQRYFAAAVGRSVLTASKVPGTRRAADSTPYLVQVVSLPGAVTGTVRKGWRVLGCLAQAVPQVLESTGETKSKTDIRDLTHLHHALDACVLVLASHSFPKDGALWEAMVVRSPNVQQKQLLQATGAYEFDREDKPHLKDLPVELKQQIANRLAEKRVVQHIPADMSGMRVEENTRGIVKVENGRATLRQQKRNAEGKLEVKETEEAVGKLVGLAPQKGQGKLTPMKGARVITDNFGVAILDHATNPEDKFIIIPWHKVWHRIDELKSKNSGHPARVLRIGTLVRVQNKSGRSDYRGVWMLRGAQQNQNAGMLVDLSSPDVITYRVPGRKDCKQNVSLKSLVEGGLEILKPSLTGIAQVAMADKAGNVLPHCQH